MAKGLPGKGIPETHARYTFTTLMHFTDAKVHTDEQDAYTMPIFPSPPHGSRPIDITVSSSRCAGAFERVARTGAGDVCRVRGCAARSTCSSASSNHEIPSVSFRSPSPRYEQLYDPRLADFRLQSKDILRRRRPRAISGSWELVRRISISDWVALHVCEGSRPTAQRQ